MIRMMFVSKEKIDVSKEKIDQVTSVILTTETDLGGVRGMHLTIFCNHL